MSFLFTGVTLVLAIQLLSLGVIAAQGKRYFEELFHLGTSIYRRVRPDEGGTADPDADPEDEPLRN